MKPRVAGDADEQRAPYAAPTLTASEPVYDVVEVAGSEVIVHLTAAFFALPDKWRVPVLELLLAHHAAIDSQRRALSLRGPTGKAIGRFSRERGLELRPAALQL